MTPSIRQSALELSVSPLSHALALALSSCFTIKRNSFLAVEASLLFEREGGRDRENMQIPHEKSETSPYVTLTLGVTTVQPKQKSSIDSIILSADKALYSGKLTGKNNVSRIDDE